MERQEVKSTVIGAVGHSRVLEIQFESGRIYQYFNVPEDVYDEMLKADRRESTSTRIFAASTPIRKLRSRGGRSNRETRT